MKKETCNLPFKLQLKSLLFFVVSVRWIPMRREREAQNAEGKCEQGFWNTECFPSYFCP
mgnify:CR=1 FL=1